MRTVILPDDTEVDVLTYSAAEALAAADKFWQRRQAPSVQDLAANALHGDTPTLYRGHSETPRLTSRKPLEEPAAPQARVDFLFTEDAQRLRVDHLDDGSVALSVPRGASPLSLNIRVEDGVAIVTPLEDDYSPCLCEGPVLDI